MVLPTRFYECSTKFCAGGPSREQQTAVLQQEPASLFYTTHSRNSLRQLISLPQPTAAVLRPLAKLQLCRGGNVMVGFEVHGCVIFGNDAKHISTGFQVFNDHDADIVLWAVNEKIWNFGLRHRGALSWFCQLGFTSARLSFVPAGLVANSKQRFCNRSLRAFFIQRIAATHCGNSFHYRNPRPPSSGRLPNYSFAGAVRRCWLLIYSYVLYKIEYSR